MFLFQYVGKTNHASEAVVPKKEQTVDYLNLNRVTMLLMSAFYPSEQVGSMTVPKIVSDAISKVLKPGAVSEMEITAADVSKLKKEIGKKLKGKDYETAVAIINTSIYSGYKKGGNASEGF